MIVQKKLCSAPRCTWKKFKKGYVQSYGGYAKSWTGKWKTYTF